MTRFIPRDAFDRLTSVLRDPLVSFLPQMALVVIAGFVLSPRTSLAFTMFVQTAVFVVWNKVCTSQVSIGPNLTER
jgi:phosphatidylinositol glycan class M